MCFVYFYCTSNISLPYLTAGMRLGQGLMAAAAGSSNPHHNNHRSSSGNKLHPHTDSGDGYEGNSSSSFNHHQSDGSVPTEFLCAINGHVMKAPLRYDPVMPICLSCLALLSTFTITIFVLSRSSQCNLLVNSSIFSPNPNLT